MWRLFCVSLAVVTLFCAPASAKDPHANWTGFYAGLNAGYDWGRSDNISTTSTDAFDLFAISPAPGFPWGAVSAATATGNAHAPLNSFVGGGQLGYNWQFEKFGVTGIEADIDVLSSNHSDGSFANSAPLLPGAPALLINSVASVDRSLDYIGTLRGRLGGLVTPTLLLYGTGGLAYGGVHGETVITQGTTPVVAVPSSGSAGNISDIRFGWTVGGGLEWLLPPHWSFKAEYLYYDLGTVSWASSPLAFINFTGTSPPGSTISIANPVSSTRFNGDIVRVGLNYHFGE
jgi:outer membrane immunogenic protein